MQQVSLDLSTPAATTVSKAVCEEVSAADALTGRARTVFDAMAAIVEAPGCILQHYKVDFYKYDAEYLARSHAIGLHLWILRPSGTHLIRVGVHPALHEYIDAALSVGPSHTIYLIDPERVSITKITETRARELAGKYEFTTDECTVTKAGQIIARIDVSFTPYSCGKEPRGIVTLYRRTDAPLSKGDLIALWQIAGCEVTKRGRSLFTKTESVTLDGEDLYDLIERA